jgi:predicted DCC family thiol-disulfide oxidoreductase YuxK
VAELSPDLVFYDGDCGLCHRSVRWIVAHDGRGAFRFAPLGGETFRALVPADTRAALPDSLVVRTAEGALLLRSEGTRRVLRRLGGAWAALAVLLGLVPRALRDAAYDAVAHARSRLFPRPTRACPVAAPELRARFLA